MFDQCRCVNTTRTSHTHTHSLESSTNSVFLTSDSFAFHSEIVFVSSTFFFFFSSTLQLFSIDDATAPGRILWLPFLFLLILHLVDVVLCFSQNRSNIEKFVFTTRVHTHTPTQTKPMACLLVSSIIFIESFGYVFSALPPTDCAWPLWRLCR